jgi:AraC-like DNA-binding protein
MKLTIKNMVCPRCIMVVRALLTSMGYHPTEVALGHAVIEEETLTPARREALDAQLRNVGFELMADSDDVLVERIKIALQRYARTEGGLRVKISQALERELGVTYKSLSSTFSQLEGRTLESYYIRQRIEYVKELVGYGDLTLTEIAFRTGYSSVAYLSRQFAQVVGMTLSDYRRLGADGRRPLTDV